MLIIFGGLPGTGKTTISKEVAKRLKAVYLRMDTIEQTFKTDYVAFYDAQNAYDFIMRQLPQWFHDYNENPPHKGLNMMPQDSF